MTGWPELRVSIGTLGRRDDLAELKRRGTVDSSIGIDETVEAHGIEITTARVPDGSPVHVRGQIDAGLSGLELRATIWATWEGECRRCLTLVTAPLAIDVHTTFLPDGSGADDADTYTFDGDTVDVGEVVREELMLALPLTPLCDDGCEGADPERFNTAIPEEPLSDDGNDLSIDPRWAALSELSFDED